MATEEMIRLRHDVTRAIAFYPFRLKHAAPNKVEGPNHMIHLP